MPFQTKDFSNIRNIGEIDEAWGLNRDTPITRSHRRNRECGVGHDVEHSNDLTDDVAARRDGYLFTIGVRDHFVEHEGIWPKEALMIVMSGFRYFSGLIHSNVPLVGEPWMSMEYCMALLFLYQ